MIDTPIHTRHGPSIARIRRIAVALTALLGSTSCEKVNPYWCEGHPKNDCRLDGGAAGDVGGSAACTHDQCVESNACLPDGTCASSADVSYVQGDAATGDFHLVPGSAPPGKGDSAFVGDELSQRDLDGDPRQNPPDIGADEAP